MAKYKCYACGDAENCDWEQIGFGVTAIAAADDFEANKYNLCCTLEVDVGIPGVCPVSGDEAEWIEQEQE